jgi:hypothetical protein
MRARYAEFNQAVSASIATQLHDAHSMLVDCVAAAVAKHANNAAHLSHRQRESLRRARCSICSTRCLVTPKASATSSWLMGPLRRIASNTSDQDGSEDTLPNESVYSRRFTRRSSRHDDSTRGKPEAVRTRGDHSDRCTPVRHHAFATARACQQVARRRVRTVESFAPPRNRAERAVSMQAPGHLRSSSGFRPKSAATLSSPSDA